jgi:hypothetical protein
LISRLSNLLFNGAGFCPSQWHNKQPDTQEYGGNQLYIFHDQAPSPEDFTKPLTKANNLVSVYDPDV